MDVEVELSEIKHLLLDVLIGLKRLSANTGGNKAPLRIEAASKLIGLKPATIRTLTSANKIPHIRKGKFLYFYEHELLSWLNEGRQNTQSEIRDEVNQSMKLR